MDLDTKKAEIQNLGLNAIQEYFKVDVTKLDKETVHLLNAKAKLGMSFEREMSVSKRAIELNYIRVFRMVAEDKAELKAYIKKSPMNTYLIK